MDILIWAILIAVGGYFLKSRDESRRIALLGSYLGKYEIEKLMESLTHGTMRALGESDPARQEQVWNLLDPSGLRLSEQFNSFVAEFAKVDAADARVSTLRLPIPIPYAAKLFPQATFDVRKVLAVHASGIANAAKNSLNRSPKDKAFTLMAELFLMQHTCHWYCKSKTVASARLLVRHQTAYALVLDSVAPDTRRAYLALTQK